MYLDQCCLSRLMVFDDRLLAFSPILWFILMLYYRLLVVLWNPK